MDIEKIWSMWSANHDTDDQKKRIESSVSASLTPIIIDHDTASGVFQSKRGRYETTLKNCSCGDFIRRQLPCKHMYRLAAELGLLQTNVDCYCHGGYSWKEAVELVEQYPEDVQKEFYSHFLCRCKSNKSYRRKKSPELDQLISDGILIEYPENETKCFKTVLLIPDFLVDKQKLHFYFSRKFNPPSYFDGVEMVREELPDDDVTAFLRERGFV